MVFGIAATKKDPNWFVGAIQILTLF